MLGLGPVEDRLDGPDDRVEVRTGEPVRIDENEIGLHPRAERSDPARERRCPGPARGRHGQHLLGRRHALVHARLAVQAKHEPHLLEHVAVVVQPCLVDPEGHVHSPPGKPVEGEDSTPEPQVGAAVVADVGARVGGELDVGLGHPDPVPEGDVGSQHSAPLKVLEGRSTGPPPGVLLLVDRLEEVDVQRHLVPARGGVEELERGVRAPVQIPGSELDGDPRVARIAP